MIDSLLDFKINMRWRVRRHILEIGLSELGGEEEGETIARCISLLRLP